MTGRRAGRRWRQLRAAVLAASDICWLCGQPGADTVDHVIPIVSGGGEFDLSNLRPAHGKRIPDVCAGNFGRGASDGNRMRSRRPNVSRPW